MDLVFLQALQKQTVPFGRLVINYSTDSSSGNLAETLRRLGSMAAQTGFVK